MPPQLSDRPTASRTASTATAEKFCILGAGSSGLAVAKNFRAAGHPVRLPRTRGRRRRQLVLRPLGQQRLPLDAADLLEAAHRVHRLSDARALSGSPGPGHGLAVLAELCRAFSAVSAHRIQYARRSGETAPLTQLAAGEVTLASGERRHVSRRRDRQRSQLGSTLAKLSGQLRRRRDSLVTVQDARTCSPGGACWWSAAATRDSTSPLKARTTPTRRSTACAAAIRCCRAFFAASRSIRAANGCCVGGCRSGCGGCLSLASAGWPGRRICRPSADHAFFETHPAINGRWPLDVARGAIVTKPDIRELQGERGRIRRRHTRTLRRHRLRDRLQHLVSIFGRRSSSIGKAVDPSCFSMYSIPSATTFSSSV